MEILDLQQGSEEWLAVRAQRFTGSEAAAMLGLSPYQTRSALLKQKATGIAPEVSPAQQRLFDRGHAVEELARPMVEADIGDDLFPTTGTLEVDGLPLLASFDGLTMDEAITWEHKLWNESLAQAVIAGEVPDSHWPQLEHGLLVSGAEKCRFTVSDGEERKVDFWYKSVPERRARLIAGWKQFAADLANYTHVEVVEQPKATTIETLPAVSVQVEGRVVASNLADFKTHAAAWIAAINMNPETDQDFADAEQRVKDCEAAEKRLDAAKEQIQSQAASIDEVFRTIDAVKAELRNTRLALDKAVKSKKDEKRTKIVLASKEALAVHVMTLNQRIGKNYMPFVGGNFAEVIKGKKLLSSIQDAVDTELARAKAAANEVADRIEANMKLLAEHADHAFLFADEAQLVLKDNEYVQLAINQRIADHQQAAKAKEDEAARVEAAATEIGKLISPVTIPAVENRQAKGDPTMKLGVINARLGFSVTAEFLKSLGFEGKKVQNACMFHEEDFTLICAALVRHIEGVCQKAAA
ncbi:MAG: Heme peroxidase [Burkholderiaceae bacterium]|nr:Heme peroxidase [Burkholderiaceae bacterium]